MPAALRSRIVRALLLLLMGALWTDARSADAHWRKSLLAPSEESELVLRRAPRPLSRREIFQAIQGHLAQMGVSGCEGLRLGDLKIQSSVPVLSNDAGLEVKGISFDPIRRETIFELWTSHEPQFLPFEVSTHRDLQSLGLASILAEGPGDAGRGVRTRSLTTGQGTNRDRFKPPVLAKPGQPATLVMLGQNVRITTTVIPLQPGSKGQRILVRDPATARVMAAEVVDEGLLQTSF